MASESRSITAALAKEKAGLIYDADGVTLLGKYGDELTAHRSKKQWVEVLNSYFLLELERDYDIFVESNIDTNYFVLNCVFSSACGRYAFWRLINQQAPEAEELLGDTLGAAHGKKLFRSDKRSWISSALRDQHSETQETTSLMTRLMQLFQ
jgi:hypothetical protein